MKKRKKIREGTHSMNVVKSELCRWVAGGANADAEAESEDRCFWRVIPEKGKEGGSRISQGKPVGRANTSPLWGKREEVTMVKIWRCWLIQWVSFHWLLELSPRRSVLAHWLETAPEQEDLGMGTRARPPSAVSGDTADLQLKGKFPPDERDKGLTSQATSLVQKPAYMTLLYIF